MTAYNLTPLPWPADDPYSDPAAYRAGERYWWHQSIAAELYRLHLLGYESECVDGIAGNLNGMFASDVAGYVRQMLAWGEVVRADARSDYEPKTWVALAPAEYEHHEQRMAREQRSAQSRGGWR